MRALVLIVTLLASVGFMSTSSHAQPKACEHEIDSLVRHLSWDSVRGTCNGYWRIFPDGPAAKRLIEIGKPATAKLVQVLTDEERGVAAHLILSAIWDGENVRLENWVEGDQVEVSYFFHVYNGLKWADVLKWKDLQHVSYKFDPADLARNSRKWKRRLSRRR